MDTKHAEEGLPQEYVNGGGNLGTLAEPAPKGKEGSGESNSACSIDELAPQALMTPRQDNFAIPRQGFFLLQSAPQPECATQFLQAHAASVPPSALLPNRPNTLPSASLLAGLRSATQVASPPLSLQQASVLEQQQSTLLSKQATGLWHHVSHAPTNQSLAADQSSRAFYSPPAQPTLTLPISLAQQLSATQNMVSDPYANARDQFQLLGHLLDPHSNVQGKSQLRQRLIQQIVEVNQLERFVSQQQAGLAVQDRRNAHLLRELLVSQAPSSAHVAAREHSQLLQRLMHDNSTKDKIIALLLSQQQTTYRTAASANHPATSGRRGTSAAAEAAPHTRPPLPRASPRDCSSDTFDSAPGGDPDRPGEATPVGRASVQKMCNGRWMARYEELKRFKREHGHCNVPHGWGENRGLSWWVMNQRAQRRALARGGRSWLSDERVAMLDALEFCWDPTARSGGWIK